MNHHDGLTTANISIGALTTHPTYQPTIRTAAVRTKAGWLGQILVDDEIVWESAESHLTEAFALDIARSRVRTRLRKTFG